MFVEKYLASLNSSNLQDDDTHAKTEPLAAAALADLSGGSGSVFGSMLARVKYAEGVPRKTFESGNHSMAVLLRVWEQAVISKGKERGWIKIVHTWDIGILEGICKKIARHSLAHWLDGQCTACNGTRIVAGRACIHCADTPGLEPVQGGALERDRIREMIGELEGLYQSHGARAAVKMRKAA